MWLRVSTSWRHSTGPRASTRKPSCSTSARSLSERRPSAPIILMWPRASTTSRFSTIIKASTARPNPFSNVRSPSWKRPSGPSIPMWPNAQQPGDALHDARPVREGRTALSTCTCHLGEGPRSRASQGSHSPQQPGGALSRPKAVREGGTALSTRTTNPSKNSPVGPSQPRSVDGNLFSVTRKTQPQCGGERFSGQSRRHTSARRSEKS